MAVVALDDVLVEQHKLQHPQGGLGFKFTEGNKKFVFLTDNELTEEGWAGACFKDFVDFCQEAEVLVHDCQYFPEEVVSRRGWGHSDTKTVAKLAIETGAKKLILFHHDPWRTDKGVKEIIDRCAQELDRFNCEISVDAAREGAGTPCLGGRGTPTLEATPSNLILLLLFLIFRLLNKKLLFKSVLIFSS
jgi:ribonuclease BN (tRNA processing enzyme)